MTLFSVPILAYGIYILLSKRWKISVCQRERSSSSDRPPKAATLWKRLALFLASNCLYRDCASIKQLQFWSGIECINRLNLIGLLNYLWMIGGIMDCS
jgi:hypothetical protein